MNLIKKPTENLQYTVNFEDLLDDGIILSSIDDIETDLTVTNQAINSSAIEVDGVSIAEGKAVQLDVADGTDGIEYPITFTVTDTDGNVFEKSIYIFVTTGDFNYYGSQHDADKYFNSKLNTTIWSNATDANKIRGLITATRAIDNLNFKGDRTSDEQINQFPRCENLLTPLDIEYATYEEAFELLSGRNVNQEISNQNVLSRSFASVRTTYDRAVSSENIQAGIVSSIAWNFLVPYLYDPCEIKLSRVD